MAKAGTAWKWVRAHPAALVLVVVLAAAAYVLYRTATRTEGWEFSGKNWAVSDDVKKDVRRYCGQDGKSLDQLTQETTFDYLKDFRKSDIARLCNYSRDKASGAVQNVGSKCGNGPCMDPNLRDTYPCQNKKGTKCCKRVFDEGRGVWTLRECQKTDMASNNDSLFGDNIYDKNNSHESGGGGGNDFGLECTDNRYVHGISIWADTNAVTGLQVMCADAKQENKEEKDNFAKNKGRSGSPKGYQFIQGLDAAQIYTGKVAGMSTDVVRGLNVGNQNTTNVWTGFVGQRAGTGKNWKCGGGKVIYKISGKSGDYIDKIRFHCRDKPT